MAKEKGATVEQMKTATVEIEALEKVRESLTTEIQNLHASKAVVGNDLDAMRRTLHQLDMKGKMDANMRSSASELAMTRRANELNQKEKNLEVIGRHLTDRENSVSVREKRVYEIEQQRSKIQADALAVEKMRKQLASDINSFTSKRAEIEAKMADVLSIQQDATLKLKEAKQIQAETLASELRERDHRRVIEQERLVIDQARVAMGLKAEQKVEATVATLPAQPARRPGRPRKNA